MTTPEQREKARQEPALTVEGLYSAKDTSTPEQREKARQEAALSVVWGAGFLF